MTENTPNLNSHAESTVVCAVCLDKIKDEKTLKCRHSFCSECIDSVFNVKPACPICNTFHGVYTGTQPKGTMTVAHSWLSLPGYEGCGSFTIQYSFPAGIQGVSLIVSPHRHGYKFLLLRCSLCPPGGSVVSC